ncbi:hypothetical protein EHP00_833 [Ecytonucleospora hepatopenaei]|uniref:Uncharacterized protein n=1 Tax=Ecytonucleospora hepatopenaei TaxID=646526 RepID=A0A1W0E4N0_9MICR|nr:hypothetical protein EHP00_833 [Ecytonucleospora hepatopenaei]
MMRDFIIILIGTIKLVVLIALSIKLATKDNKTNEMCIPVIGAFVFMWVTWIVTYISQIHPFILPEIVK